MAETKKSEDQLLPEKEESKSLDEPTDREYSRQMQAARKIMEEYRETLERLAKS